MFGQKKRDHLRVGFLGTTQLFRELEATADKTASAIGEIEALRDCFKLKAVGHRLLGDKDRAFEMEGAALACIAQLMLVQNGEDNFSKMLEDIAFIHKTALAANQSEIYSTVRRMGLDRVQLTRLAETGNFPDLTQAVRRGI